MIALGPHLQGFKSHHAKKKGHPKGDPEAFVRFYNEMVAAVPKCASSFEL
jgi:hypothetical protein